MSSNKYKNEIGFEDYEDSVRFTKHLRASTIDNKNTSTRNYGGEGVNDSIYKSGISISSINNSSNSSIAGADNSDNYNQRIPMS